MSFQFPRMPSPVTNAANPLLEPHTQTADVPNAPTGPRGEMVADGSTAPGSMQEMHHVFMRASQALEAAARDLRKFPTARMVIGDAASPPQITLVPLDLKGIPIRSVFVQYGFQGQSTTTPLKLYIGSSGSGNPILTANAGSWYTVPIGDGVFELSIIEPATTTSQPYFLVVTDEVWAPSQGKIV